MNIQQQSPSAWILIVFIIGTTQLASAQGSPEKINKIYHQALQIQDQDPEEAIGLLNQIIEIDSLVYGAYITIAALKLAMDEKEESIEYVREAVRKGFTNLIFIKNDPRFSSLGDYPEFIAIINGEDDQLVAEGVGSRLDFYASLLGKEGYNRYLNHELKIAAYIHSPKEEFDEVISKLMHYSKKQVEYLFSEPLQEYVFITVVDSVNWIEKLNRSPYSLGGFSPQSNSLMTYKMNTVIHEFTHTLHFNHQNLLNQHHPAWVNEGLGTNFDAITYNTKDVPVGISNARLPYLKSILKNGDEITWEDLFQMNQSAFMQNAQAVYAQAGYIFRYLQARGVLHHWYREYIKDYDDDPSGVKTLKKYLGEDLDKAEAEWKAWVLEQSTEPYIPLGFTN